MLLPASSRRAAKMPVGKVSRNEPLELKASCADHTPLPATGSLLHCLLCRPDAFGPLACLEHLPWCKCEQWRCKRAKKGARMEHDLTRAETMAPLMLKHDGKPNRWCSVQEDVEDYFRKTFGEVRAACRRLVLLVHMGLMLSAAVLRDAIMTASVLPVWRVCCAANHDHRWCNEHCHLAIQAPGERALVSCLASHCLRQEVAFAPKVIIIACLRQVVAFAPHV
jgi:hypothetical protein